MSSQMSDTLTPRRHVANVRPAPAFAVLGARSWGTTLGAALQRGGCRVTVWTRRADMAHAIETARHNRRHLPGIRLPQGMRAGIDIASVVENVDGVMLAVPSTASRAVARCAAPWLTADTPVLAVCKGIEHVSGALRTQVLQEEPGDEALTGVIAGPSFADEVARGLPTRLTLAMRALSAPLPVAPPTHAFADMLCQALHGAGVALERTDDVIGVQIGGALKNMIAIACGMATAQGMGENARAAIVSRGLDDMRRLTLALGGRSDTLFCCSGVGDLFLTAASTHSRNTRLGLRLGRGESADELSELAEGALSSQSVQVLERRLGLQLRVPRAVRDVLARRVHVGRALQRLLHDELDPAASQATRHATLTVSGGRLAHDPTTLRLNAPHRLQRAAQ
ncbi:MAG: NAD(P)-dependent glycerol-3-phosphate dehydrogenase [Proteobacteria bacterium]|nr:NAD(P)-dependent glycerol-3-phosphate dehydrogenase [Pseudomonadota bacterium]